MMSSCWHPDFSLLKRDDGLCIMSAADKWLEDFVWRVTSRKLYDAGMIHDSFRRIRREQSTSIPILPSYSQV